MRFFLVKFIYSEKATKFFEISTLDLTVCTVVKCKVEILQNCVAFSEYMNYFWAPEICQNYSLSKEELNHTLFFIQKWVGIILANKFGPEEIS